MEIEIPRSMIASSVLTNVLQRGVLCPARLPTAVAEFITGQLGWAPEYLRDRISTIFLDGKVVDDPATAMMTDGAGLSLSAAMPGLVGATLRRSGYYAAMRSQISWSSEATTLSSGSEPGLVEIRLYNLILVEKAEDLLARGILVDGRRLAELVGEADSTAMTPPNDGLCLLRLVEAPDESRE